MVFFQIPEKWFKNAENLSFSFILLILMRKTLFCPIRDFFFINFHKITSKQQKSLI